MNHIVLKNISYKYPMAENYALQDVNFTFEEGKFYGIVGPNGGGKSTLCNLLVGLIPDFYQGDLTGEMDIFGRSRQEWGKKLCTKVGYIFQNPFTQISGIKDTVLEEIAIGLENLGMGKEQMLSRVMEVVNQVGIYDLIDKNPNELSGGQRQRVAFASILAMDMDIFVIDEPTSQLDPEGTENIFRIIRSLKEKKKTIILVEHKVELMAEYADEVIVMKDGNILCSGPVQEIFSDYTLEDQNVAVPQVALFGRDMMKAGKALQGIPITLNQAEKYTKERGI